MGDFAILEEIPEMYRHCKATEDKDMTPLDFLTDHLVNIDGLFDKHDDGDEQKPHESHRTKHYQGQPTVFFATYFSFFIKQVIPVHLTPGMRSENFLSSDYFSEIFRPPIV